MPWEQGELHSGVSAVVILNNTSPQHMPAKVLKGVSCVFVTWKLSHLQLQKQLQMKLWLTEHGWYWTPESEIFGRSNFHVGQQLFQKLLHLSKAQWELFYPARLCVSVRDMLGREANVICCRIYFFPEQAPIKCAQGKSILTICTQIKYPCVLDDLD